MSDRLAEIERQWAKYPYLHDAATQNWLIAEVERLRLILQRLVELGHDDGTAPDDAWARAWADAEAALPGAAAPAEPR